MDSQSSKHNVLIALAAVTLLAVSSAGAQQVHVSTFATGTAVNATGPDSIALSSNSIWVSYTNGADSTGLGGSSTIVQYKKSGSVRTTYSIAGSVDGLKVDPETRTVWAMQNQDGNSTLTLISPKTRTTSAPISYAVKSATQGYDDVVFRAGQIFVSYTNPTLPTDPTIQLVRNVSNPIVVSNVLLMGATGTDLATGKANQPTTQTDPDSLKLTPHGDLMLTSGNDGQLIFVAKPGTSEQAVSFLQLRDQSGNAVSGLDDAVFATTHEGTFWLTETGANRVLKIKAEDLPVGSLYACVSSVNALVSVNLKTGVVTPVVSNLNAPHGLEFVPDEGDDE
jgi:hypothetical protein